MPLPIEAFSFLRYHAVTHRSFLAYYLLNCLYSLSNRTILRKSLTRAFDWYTDVYMTKKMTLCSAGVSRFVFSCLTLSNNNQPHQAMSDNSRVEKAERGCSWWSPTQKKEAVRWGGCAQIAVQGLKEKAVMFDVWVLNSHCTPSNNNQPNRGDYRW